MKFRNTRYLFLLPLIILIACQKEVHSPDTINRIQTDSSLLVKSISITYYDSSFVAEDSLTESYNYDTVNRKITLTWTDSDVSGLDGVKEVLSYNTSDLLTGVEYIYPPGFPFWAADVSTASISYDNQNVLKSITIQPRQGTPEIKIFTKTSTSSGYKLSWVTPDFLSEYHRTATFTTDDVCIRNLMKYYIFDLNNNVQTTGTSDDSLVYDAAGSLNKMFTHYTDSASQTDDRYLYGEYISRQTKGDQLFNQRSLLLNGIQHMPFEAIDAPLQLTLLAFSDDPYDDEEFSIFPIQSARVRRNIDDNYGVFTSSSTFDSQDRLVSFTGFFNDTGLKPQVYKITYYK